MRSNLRHRALVAAGVSLLTSLVCTTAQAVSVPILNPSFESFTGAASDNWTSGSLNVNNGTSSGARTPTDGVRLQRLNGAQSHANNLPVLSFVRQTLSEVIDETAIYTLTVDLGPSGGTASGGARLYWDNAGTPVEIVRAGYRTNTNGYTTLNLQASGAELAGLGGNTLGIELFSPPSNSSVEVAFDNVRLDKSPGYTPTGGPIQITVPDFSFEQSGTNDNSWTANPVVWGGEGWPINGTGYGQAATDGSDKATNTAYQLMPALNGTYIEGATYTLRVDASMRGDQGPVTDATGIVLYREDQDIGGPATSLPGPTIGILDGELAPGNNPAGLNGASDWTTLTLTYTATAADHGQRIGIGVLRGLNGPQPVFDNVRLEYVLGQPVPEPSSIVLGLLGLVGIGLYGWRRARR